MQETSPQRMVAVALLLVGLLAGACPAARAANFDTSACGARADWGAREHLAERDRGLCDAAAAAAAAAR